MLLQHFWLGHSEESALQLDIAAGGLFTHKTIAEEEALCWVHKPRVPQGPASMPRLGPSRQHVTHGLAQESKTIGQKGSHVTDRKVWPKRNNAHSSAASAHLSDRSVRFGFSRHRTASPIGRPGPKHYFRLRPRDSDRRSQEPCSPLFSNRRTQSRL